MENTGLNSSVENVIISTAKPTIKYKNFNDFQKKHSRSGKSENSE